MSNNVLIVCGYYLRKQVQRIKHTTNIKPNNQCQNNKKLQTTFYGLHLSNPFYRTQSLIYAQLDKISMQNIFNNTPGWTYSEQEQKAEAKIAAIQKEARNSVPKSMYSQKCVTLFDELKHYKLYSVLKTIPKGVLHHIHFDCCEDPDFYAQHVVNDPIVYLNKEKKEFRIGTNSQAVEQKWVSMQEYKEQCGSSEEFIKRISNLTMLSKQEMKEINEHEEERWEIFQKKIQNFFPILGATHLFKKYIVHVLRKFVRNGYDRIQFRCLLTKLTEYDQQGKKVIEHSEKKFLQIADEAISIVKGQHPQLTVGFIFFGLKMLPAEQNERILTTALEQRWDKTIGIDFVQQEDPYGDQAPYDVIADKVLAKFTDLDIKKVYHVGETVDHLNNNIEVAINGGSYRIGHGINIFQRSELLQVCINKKICFEKCPISNIFMTYCKDPRQGTSPLLQGLGIPITVNSDDPGKFGVEDGTMDYMFAFICYNWSLKNLKLLAINSINHAICSEQTKKELFQSLNLRWKSWIDAINALE